MTNSNANRKLIEFLKISTIIISLILLLVNPKLNMSSFYNGIILWAKFVLPALFPILFLTSIINAGNLTKKLGNKLSFATTKLFNCSGISGYVYITSILSGYPVGAKTTSELYEKGLITQTEAIRITSFSSTSGPLFILGTVGIGMFNSSKMGIIILLSHLLGAFFNGILYRNLYKNKIYNFQMPLTTNPNNILESCMLSSIKSILIIGGYISISYMLISILNSYNIFLPISSLLNQIFNIDINISNAILNGIVEVTKGCADLSGLNLNFYTNTLISTALISLGGLSIFLQAFTYLAKFKIKLSVYILQKISHTLLSLVICTILILIF